MTCNYIFTQPLNSGAKTRTPLSNWNNANHRCIFYVEYFNLDYNVQRHLVPPVANDYYIRTDPKLSSPNSQTYALSAIDHDLIIIFHKGNSCLTTYMGNQTSFSSWKKMSTVVMMHFREGILLDSPLKWGDLFFIVECTNFKSWSFNFFWEKIFQKCIIREDHFGGPSLGDAHVFTKCISLIFVFIIFFIF